MSEVVAGPEHDFLPVKEVLSLQSLAMGVLGEQARRKVFKPKMTGYVLFESSGQTMGSNSVDTYMGIVSRRLDIGYWQFTVSFLSSMMNHELRYSNTRELHRFNWNRQGYCVGTKIVTDNYNPIVSTRHDTENGMIDVVDPHTESWWRPIDVTDCDDLSERMLETATQIKLHKSEKFGADWNAI